VTAALRPRPEPLERRTLVDVGRGDPEHAPVPPANVVRVSDRAGKDLADRLARGLRCELEHRLRLVGGQPADQVHHPARLHRRDAHVPRPCPGFHWCFLFSGLSPAAPVVLDVAAESPRGRELAELVADHRLGDEHRDVLATVVHRDGVTEHVGHDHRAPRPRLDDVLGALRILDVHLLLQVVVDEGPLLQAARHRVELLALLVGLAAADDEGVACLAGTTGAAFGLAPRADRVSATGGLAFATAERVVDRVHGDTADGRALALPAHAAGLAPVDVRLLGVADLADGGAAAHVDVWISPDGIRSWA